MLVGMGMGRGEGEEVRVNTLFKLWTIYLWLTSQFSTVKYIYVANPKRMATQETSPMGVSFTHGLTNNINML